MSTPAEEARVMTKQQARKRKRSRYRWTVHNIVGHPLSEILHLLGCRRLSKWAHDATLPSED